MEMKLNLRKYIDLFLKIIILFFGCISLTIIIKVFFFASYKVPSGSMDPTLKTGDYIIVNKLIPGPRIFKDWKFIKTSNWEMKRLKGIRMLKHNEIIVFNFPFINHEMSRIEMDFNNFHRF